MLELADKHGKTVIIPVFQVLKKLSRDIENILKDSSQSSREETIMCRMKNTLNEIRQYRRKD